MKRTKKLLVLALALMMALSCMATPAMAHGDEDEGIMPLYEATHCPECGKEARVTRSYIHDDYWEAINCQNSVWAHLHLYESIYTVRTACMYCDYDDTYYSPIGNGICPFNS